MRKQLFLLSALAILLVSCSKDSAEVTCRSVNNPYQELITVSDEPFTLTKADNDNKSELKLDVAITLKTSLSGIQNIKPEDIEITNGMTLKVYGEKTGVVATLKADSEEAIKTLLQSNEGTTKTISFSVKTTADQAKEAIATATFFEIDAPIVDLKNINLSGAIGAYPAKMTLNVAHDGKVTGAYYYERMGSNNLLYLVGDLKKDGSVQLDEYTAQGNQSAEYGCTFKDGKLMGSFATTGGRTYSLTFNPDKEMQPLPYINVIRGGDTASYDTSIKAGGGSGSSDLLDEYEAYVDELIEFIRKMDKDDPTAMANYFKVMQKAMSLSERLEKERSSLSTGDLERLIQIQQKMNNAIAEMNN